MYQLGEGAVTLSLIPGQRHRFGIHLLVRVGRQGEDRQLVIGEVTVLELRLECRSCGSLEVHG